MSVDKTIKRGDRVRVTFEATVQFAGSAGIDFQRNETGAKPRSLLYNDGYENVVVEKIEPPRKTLREQYEALPVGARFNFVLRGKKTSGEERPLRIKLSDDKYYQPGLDIMWSRDEYWIMDDDSFDIKEV